VTEDDWRARHRRQFVGSILLASKRRRSDVPQGNAGRIVNIASQAAKIRFSRHPGFTIVPNHGLCRLVSLDRHRTPARTAITVNNVLPQTSHNTALGALQMKIFWPEVNRGADSVEDYLKANGRRASNGPSGPARRHRQCGPLALLRMKRNNITAESNEVSGGEETALMTLPPDPAPGRFPSLARR